MGLYYLQFEQKQNSGAFGAKMNWWLFGITMHNQKARVVSLNFVLN